MAWIYLCCSKGHIYRVIKTKDLSPLVTCPFCGSTWKFRTTKREWVIWREWYFSLGLKRYNRA